jgi:hypothetical protein
MYEEELQQMEACLELNESMNLDLNLDLDDFVDCGLVPEEIVLPEVIQLRGLWNPWLSVAQQLSNLCANSPHLEQVHMQQAVIEGLASLRAA